MFPTLGLDKVIEEIEGTENRKQGVTFLYDFDKGEFVLRDGRLVEVQGKEATKVRLEKLIRTEKLKFKIYEKDGKDEFGITIKQLLQGRKLPQFFLQSELKREIEEAAKKHIEEIDRLEDFRTEQNLTTLKIYFTVVLANGDVFNQEVVV